MAEEERSGEVEFQSTSLTVYQEVPPGVGDHSPWFNLERMLFVYPGIGDVIFDPPTWIDDGDYAYNLGCGSTEAGLKADTSRIVLPFAMENMRSIRKAPTYSFPSSLDFLPHPIELIPEDAWITQVVYEIVHGTWPTSFGFQLHELTHTNTLLPQSSLEGTALWWSQSSVNVGDLTEIININPQEDFINARAAVNQAFDLRMSVREYQFTPPVTEPVIIRLPYIHMRISWQGITTISVDGFEGAPFGFTASFAAPAIQKVIDLSATTSLGMSLAGDMGTDFAMAGAFNATAVNVGDPSITPGITDTTGYFTPSMTLSLGLLRQTGIVGAIGFNQNLAGALEIYRNMEGNCLMSASFDASLLRLGTLSVQEDGRIQTMIMTDAPLAATRPLAGALAASMSLAGDLRVTVGMEAGLDASMVSELTLAKVHDLVGPLPMALSFEATIEKTVDMAGSFPANMGFYSELTYLRESPALEENWVEVPPRDRDVHVPPRDRTINISSQQRN